MTVEIRNKSIFLLIFIALFASPFYVKSQHTNDRKIEILRERDLVQLKEEWKENHNLIFERLIAFYFNTLINEYRISKKLVPLYWDEKLWLAARNHNIYLGHSKIFGHSENPSKNYYTGRRPEDRIRFVCHQFKPHKMAGFENCAASSFGSTPARYLFFGSTKEQETVKREAYDIALDIINLWKSSISHNANMLNPDHRIHATSIISGLGMTYGTSMFVSDPKCIQTDEFEVPALLVPDADTLLRFKEKLPTLERCKKEIKHTEYKHFALLVEYFDSLGLKPNENLYNIVKSGKNISQKNIRKLFLKKTKYLGIFKLIGKNITYITHNIKLNKEDFHLLKGMDEIDEFLSKYDSKLMKSTDWGATTNIESDGGFINLKIEMVVISDK